MKKILILVTVMLFITLTTKGQNLFFIGENSYPCTDTFTLQSNSEDRNDLNVRIAKDGTQGIFAVSTETRMSTRLIFTGKIIIYLNDGTVITCNESSKSERVDRNAVAAYYLKKEDLNSLKNNNINTVRYTLKDELGGMSPYGGNFSASNKGGSKIDFPAIITAFFSG